jgi:hypothetical protein
VTTGTIGHGKADNFFVNGYFRITDLRLMAAGTLPMPVPLEQDSDGREYSKFGAEVNASVDAAETGSNRIDAAETGGGGGGGDTTAAGGGGRDGRASARPLKRRSKGAFSPSDSSPSDGSTASAAAAADAAAAAASAAAEAPPPTPPPPRRDSAAATGSPDAAAAAGRASAATAAAAAGDGGSGDATAAADATSANAAAAGGSPDAAAAAAAADAATAAASAAADDDDVLVALHVVATEGVSVCLHFRSNDRGTKGLLIVNKGLVLVRHGGGNGDLSAFDLCSAVTCWGCGRRFQPEEAARLPWMESDCDRLQDHGWVGDRWFGTFSGSALEVGIRFRGSGVQWFENASGIRFRGSAAVTKCNFCCKKNDAVLLQAGAELPFTRLLLGVRSIWQQEDRKQRLLALMSAHHPRLGACSAMWDLAPDVLQSIARALYTPLGPDRERTCRQSTARTRATADAADAASANAAAAGADDALYRRRRHHRSR